MPTEFALMKKVDLLRQTLLWQQERLVLYETVIDVLWGADEDGGPLDARHCVREYVYALRKNGEDIETWPWIGLKMRVKNVDDLCGGGRPGG